MKLLNSKKKMNDPDRKDKFFVFLIDNDIFAIKMKYFVEVKDYNPLVALTYNDKELKVIDIRKFLNYPFEHKNNIVMILKYGFNYFALRIDDILDTFFVDDLKIISLDGIYNQPNPLIPNVLLKDDKIIKLLSVRVLYKQIKTHS